MRRSRAVALILFSLLIASCGQGSSQERWTDRIILFIGDDMGPEQIRAGSFYMGRPFSFTSFPIHSVVPTYSADNFITDSAAAATAITTSVKVANGVISMALPGTGEPLETNLEKAKNRGMLTGLVTTTYLAQATPAAFAAHQSSRTLYNAIADDYLFRSRPNVLLVAVLTDSMTRRL